MAKGWLLAALVMTTSGCLGTASDLPDEQVRYDFGTTVSVLTTSPSPGRRLNFNLEITSHSDVMVTVDILIRVYNPDGKIIHTDPWNEVVFHPEEIWNLTQGFVTATDDVGPLRLEILVLDHTTGEELWSQPDALTVQMM